MKKITILFLLLLIFIPSVFSEDISSIIDDVKQNPSAYTIVIGKSTQTEEIKVISGLASYLGITRSRFDTEIKSNNKLVIVGTYDDNNLIKSMIGSFNYGSDKALIKVVDNNVIITAESLEDLQLAIDIIQNYDKTKKSLNKEEYIAIQFLSPKNPSAWFALLGTIVIIIISTLALTKTKKQKTSELRKTQSSNPELNQQLFNYVKSNLESGYSKQQLRQALVNANWDPNTVDNTLNRFP